MAQLIENQTVTSKKTTVNASFYVLNTETQTVRNRQTANLDRTTHQYVDGWFSVLYSELYNVMFKYAKKFIFNYNDAEDVVIEAFTKGYKAICENENMNVEDFKFYMYTTIHTTAIDLIRKQKAKKRDVQLKLNQADMVDNSGNSLFFNLLDKQNSYDIDGEKSLINSEVRNFIYSAIDKINSENARTALILWLKGYKIVEIAEYLNKANSNNNMNENNTKVLIHRYRKELRLKLKAII